MEHTRSKNNWIKLNSGLTKTGVHKDFQSSRTLTNLCDLVFNLFSNHAVFKQQKAENLILRAMFVLVVQALKMIIIHSSASLPFPLIYFWYVSKLFTFSMTDLDSSLQYIQQWFNSYEQWVSGMNNYSFVDNYLDNFSLETKK